MIDIFKGIETISLAEEILKELKKRPCSTYELTMKLNKKFDINFYNKVRYILRKFKDNNEISVEKKHGKRGIINLYSYGGI